MSTLEHKLTNTQESVFTAEFHTLAGNGLEKAADPAEEAYLQTLEFARHALAQPGVRGLHVADFRNDETLERLMIDIGRVRQSITSEVKDNHAYSA